MTVFKLVTKTIVPSGASADVLINSDEDDDDYADFDSADNRKKINMALFPDFSAFLLELI